MASATSQPDGEPNQPGQVPTQDSGAGKPVSLGLAVKWDNLADIRQRMRAGMNLLVQYDRKLKRNVDSPGSIEKTVANAKVNHSVLRPVARLMASQRVLHIELLEAEVGQIFSIYNKMVSPKTLSDQAWGIRHLIQVVKGTVKIDKEDPTRLKRCPKDPGGQIKFKVYDSGKMLIKHS